LPFLDTEWLNRDLGGLCDCALGVGAKFLVLQKVEDFLGGTATRWLVAHAPASFASDRPVSLKEFRPWARR